MFVNCAHQQMSKTQYRKDSTKSTQFTVFVNGACKWTSKSPQPADLPDQLYCGVEVAVAWRFRCGGPERGAVQNVERSRTSKVSGSWRRLARRYGLTVCNVSSPERRSTYAQARWTGVTSFFKTYKTTPISSFYYVYCQSYSDYNTF